MLPLIIESLKKNYKQVTAVNDFSFAIPESKVTVLLGPNGSGKTTLLRIICGQIKPDNGQVRIFNKPFNHFDPAIRTRIGYCPQQLMLWKDLTPDEQLSFLADTYQLPNDIKKIRIKMLLDRLELTLKSKVVGGKLSGGMQRRLNLALSLIHDPSLLILDEPFSGLDPEARLMVWNYLTMLARNEGKTILLSNL